MTLFKAFTQGKAILIVCCVLFLTQTAFGQLTQDDFTRSIKIGNLKPGIPYVGMVSNVPTGELPVTNHIGQPSPEVVHRFTLTDSAVVTISHCGSAINTYLHLLNNKGSVLQFNNDNGPACSGTSASLARMIPPGVYYIVSEGSGNATGNINLTVSIPSAITSGDHTDQLTSIFSQLELSRIPYGLLRDLAVEQAELNNHKGLLLGDSAQVDNALFNQIYGTLATARATSSAYVFASANDIDSINFASRLPGRIVVSGLYIKYSEFKENAVANNLVTILNNKIYDKYINGVWQNPYNINNAVAFSTSVDIYRGLQQQLLLPASLWFTNDGSNVASLQVDAGDGLGFRNLIVGQMLNVNYADTGKKSITFKAVVSGTTLYSRSAIKILRSLEESFPSLVRIPIAATESFNGQLAQGIMTIRYANPSLGMRNPLIIAEGFDPGKIKNPETTYGETDFGTFRDALLASPQLEALLMGGATNYDIVYVDWKQGTDDIRKNALLFKQVLRYVNGRKAIAGSTSPNVVVGQSMGGLVARYALKTMENNGENHQTRLFVSFDSPHQGANIPVGYQYMANHFSLVTARTGLNNLNHVISWFKTIPNLKQVLAILHSQAAKQMLIQHVAPNGTIDNSTHQAWQNELSTLGFPAGTAGVPIRNVAISNGSECAAGQVGYPNVAMLRYEGKASTRFFGDILERFAAPGIALLSVATLRPQYLMGLIPGKNEIKFNIRVSPVSEYGDNEIFYSKITYSKKILWLIPLQLTISNDRKFSTNEMQSLETYPGGFFNTGWHPENANVINEIYKYNLNVFHIPTFNFIPVASALDVGRGTRQLQPYDYTMMYKRCKQF